MDSNDNNNLLSRKEAWWFIPEEYCPIFLELEKEFNKQIDIRRQISELESKINDTPAYKREPLKERLKNLNARREFFSRERIVKIVEHLRDDRCFHYSDLADKRLASPKNKEGRGDNTYQKFVRYADIMGHKAITKEIVEHFIKYFTHLGILKERPKGEYYFKDYSSSIANYKVPFVTARIILECLTSYLQTHQASRMMIFESMHSLNQNPLVEIWVDEFKRKIKSKNKSKSEIERESLEKALKEVYRKSLDEGLKILQNNGLITEKEDKQYEFVYEQEVEPQQENNKEVWKERNKERKLAALRKLAEISVQFQRATNTSKEKKKNKLRSAQPYISEKLSQIDQSTLNGRIIYHWYNVILQCRNCLDYSKFKAFADDIITFIRYCNVFRAVTPINKDSLYKWERGYPVWRTISKLIQEEAKFNNKNWQTELSYGDHVKTCNNLLSVICSLIGNENIVKLPSKNILEDKTLAQIRIRNNQLLSLYFVRIFIDVQWSVIHNPKLLGHLDQLLKIITSDKNGNTFDLCIIVQYLGIFSIDNTFDYALKAKSWEYTLKLTRSKEKDLTVPDVNVTTAGDFDVLETLFGIYTSLAATSCDDNTGKRYQENCLALCKELKPQNLEQFIQEIEIRYTYMNLAEYIISYQDMSMFISEQWNKIGALLSIADKEDPRPHILRCKTLIFAIEYYSKYFDLRHSAPLLLLQSYIRLQDLKIKDYSLNFELFDALGILVEKSNPELSTRIAIINANPLHTKWEHYKTIADKLNFAGDYNRALEFIYKAEESYDIYKQGDIQGQTFYLDLLLSKVVILYQIGREADAKLLYNECEYKLRALEDLYPQEIRSQDLQYALNNLKRIKSKQEKYAYRLERLLSVLTAIKDTDNISSEIESFYKKWNDFSTSYLKDDDSVPADLVEEFKSNQFLSEMEDIAKHVVFKSPEIKTTPLTDSEIWQLYKDFQILYAMEQRSLLYDKTKVSEEPAAGTTIKMPSDDELFAMLEPRRNAKVFVHKMNATNEWESRKEDFEILHFVAMSEWTSAEDRLKACQLFMDKFDKSSKSTFLREMAAEVLCQMSSLVDFPDWDKQEKLLNQAESYIINKDGSIISDRAKEIYIRIMHRLYDVYDYQERSGMQESLMVEHALELIKSNNIRTVDAAWFLGERAEYLLYINKDKQQAKTYFDNAISILKEIIPATEDSLHYLDIYQEEVVNL